MFFDFIIESYSSKTVSVFVLLGLFVFVEAVMVTLPVSEYPFLTFSASIFSAVFKQASSVEKLFV